ncbi:tyrosine recombinase XerC [Collibacillus ludicampi]|uniref:Tyrosine recombinase XerC n=1 Tax=Collibacillus ludicampi TaxID=2771369 RepID=A0AAV4LGA0_9BACL|nr:tyrosine-type recombinase/integrase [Collibacillus ludicampi]GIM46815.1 tyrosine recombinase XerC [Collibacillus ludicampi]
MDKRKGRKAIRQRQTVVYNSPKYTLDQAFNLYTHAKVTEGLRESTLKDHKRMFDYFMRWLEKSHHEIQYVDEITTSLLREYVYYMLNDQQLYEGRIHKPKVSKVGLGNQTVNLRITKLKAFFNFLVNENIISDNPAEKIKRLRVEEDTIGAFTDEQIDLLLAQPDRRNFAQNRDYVLMRFLLESGCRINEVLSLKISNIDFQTRLITLPGSQNKNRRTRVIPISKDMVRLLMELIAENKTYFPDTEYVFLTNYGEPISQRTIGRKIQEYGKKAGIANQVRCSPHTFRHTFAKNFLMAGGDIIALQRILGHSTMDMAQICTAYA